MSLRHATAAILAWQCFMLVSGRPNFVIFMADDLGYADVFGNATLPTPNIDSIARRGVLLTHHLAAAAVCTPSRAAFLTGRYPIRYGMESHGRNKVFLFLASSGGLPQSEITFPKLLQKSGYATALIGKWHLGNDAVTRGDTEHHPLRHGFDYFYGLPLTNLKDFGSEGTSVVTAYFPHFYSCLFTLVLVGMSTAYCCKRRRLLLAFVILTLCLAPLLLAAFVYNLPRLNGVIMRNSEVVEQPIRLPGLTQRLVVEANQFLRNSTGKPFLLMVNFVHVHTALFTAPHFINSSLHHGRYGDNVLELDWAVGEILRTLEDLGETSNTMVYFSSDNGGHLEEVGPDGTHHGGCNRPLKGGKAMGGVEGGIRVPTAVMWPGKIPAGLRMDTVTSQMDVFSTVLRLAHIAAPQDRELDGLDIEDVLMGRLRHLRRTALMHYCGVSLHAITLPLSDSGILKVHYATPRWIPGTDRCPYVCHCLEGFIDYHDPPLMYNLTEDIGEANPLPADVVRQLSASADKALEQHRNTLPLPRPESQFSLNNAMWKPWLQPCCNFPFCTCTDPLHPS